MSYVGGPFSNDIFVSYAHGDALRDGKSQLRRWSEGFAEQLRYELQAIPKIGSALRLFLDTSDRPVTARRDTSGASNARFDPSGGFR